MNGKPFSYLFFTVISLQQHVDSTPNISYLKLHQHTIKHNYSIHTFLAFCIQLLIRVPQPSLRLFPVPPHIDEAELVTGSRLHPIKAYVTVYIL